MYHTLSTLWHRLRKTPAHDPMDWRVGAGAGGWYTGTYCSNCMAWTEHRDIMSGICHTCGSKKGVRRYRSSRYLWNGQNWVMQHKYGDGPLDYELVQL